MPPVRTWSSRTPLIPAVAVSVVLLTSALLINRTVGRARDGAVKGLADGFVIAGREQLRRPARLDVGALTAFLEEQRADGLRYVAVLDGNHQIAAAAGDARGTAVAPGLYLIGDRARLVNPTPGADRPEAARRKRPGAIALIYEFEPLVANQLRSDARWLLLVATAASAVVLGLALWVGRGLRARERMQVELERGRRLAALGEMSAVLSHELRNPLASLKGHAQLLVELLPDEGPLRAKAERVVGESVRLESLAGNLLDFVRSGELDRAPTSPREVIAEAVADVDGDRIDVDADGAPASWHLDGPRLRQALVNILRNAIQASPDGARVTARVAAEAGRLVITVRDRGAGIPAGEATAIFEPFHTRRVRGVGLGLAIARSVVELHGGTIDAHNHDDGGAVFRIALPRSS